MTGLELAQRFWAEAVRPVIDELLPGRPRAAALFGNGSEVLGFDDERSTDHGFGPRVMVLIDGVDTAGITDELDQRLPETFAGFPVRFPRSDGARPTHAVDVTPVADWFTTWLGFDPTGKITTEDWLSAPTQLLRVATAGRVFEDSHGRLTAARRRLAWYPDDVWIYLLACQWRRLDQEEAFVGRAGEVGDELGSAVVAARLARDVMRLCFLIDRSYAPYSKWLGTAFTQLPSAADVGPALQGALAATDWHEREAHLTQAVEAAARRFNRLALVPELEPTVRPYFGRPFMVIGSRRFAGASMAATSLRGRGWIGGIDQWVDSTELLSVGAAQRPRWPGGSDPMTERRRLTEQAYADPGPLKARASLYHWLEDGPAESLPAWVLGQVEWPDQGRVLDVGPGPGTYLAELGRRHPALTPVAADLSMGMAAACRSAGLPAAVADVQQLPFRDEVFMAVIAAHMLYHAADIDAAVAELARVAQPGAAVLVVTNGRDHLPDILDLLAGAIASVGGGDWGRPTRSTDRFPLDQAERVLGAHLDVEGVTRLGGRIVVPEAEPVVAYVDSMRSRFEPSLPASLTWPAVMAAVEQMVRTTIDQEGAWTTTRATGLVVGRRRRRPRR